MGRPWRITGNIALLAIGYIASVLSFAYVWYPCVPVEKSGGNFATAKKICVQLAPSLECPNSLLPILRPKEALIQLEEDSDWAYFASDNGPEMPECKASIWSTPGYGKNYCRPFVYTVRRNCIVGVKVARKIVTVKDPTTVKGTVRDFVAGRDVIGEDVVPRCPVAPTITLLSRSTATAGSAAFTLTVNGTGFIPSSVLNFNGSARTGAYVSATQLTTAIQASDIASEGASLVTVANPEPFGGVSGAAIFTVTAPVSAPTSTSLLPPTATVARRHSQ